MRQKNKITAIIFCAIVPLMSIAQTNSVLQLKPLEEMTAADEATALNSQSCLTVYDASGRVVQEKDAHVRYDILGRKVETYNFIDDVKCDVVEYDHEDSPLNRQTGHSSQHSDGKQVTSTTTFEKPTDVYCFSMVGETTIKNAGRYTCYLSHTQNVNEDGSTTSVYHNPLGQKVLERQKLTSKVKLDTYYIYDAFGALACVLPPAAASKCKTATNYAIDGNETIHNYAYLYRYDARGRCVAQKLPGIDWSYTVYDDDDRPILTQSPLQRTRHAWHFMKYDNRSRLIIEGDVFNAQNWQQLSEQYGNSLVKETFVGGSSPYGYTNDFDFGGSWTGIRAYYYDNYNFLKLKEFTSLKGKALKGYTTVPKSLRTGSLTTDIENPSIYETEANYYDYRGREIICLRDNRRTKIRTTKTSEFNFNDKEKSVNFTYENPGVFSIDYKMQFEYDNQGRAASAKADACLTNEQGNRTELKDIVLYNYAYDKKNRMIKNEINDKLTTSYSYDEYNNLYNIENQYFKQTLFYDNPLPGNAISQPRHDGCISSFCIERENRSDNVWMKYDATGRIVNTATSSGFSEAFEYDEMGNIVRLKRKDGKRVIDDRVISYSGNQIEGCQYDANGNEIENSDRKIAEIKYNSLNLPNEVIFSNGNSLKFNYMADGKCVQTTSFTQRTALSAPIDDNCIQNPISGSSSQELSHPSVDFTEQREGNLLLLDGLPAKLEFANGYLDLRSQNLVSSTDAATITPYYFVRDHLESVRATIAHSPSMNRFNVLQQVDYAPSGTIVTNTNPILQDRLFCGKPLQTMHGWDTYDSQRRMLRDGDMRFTSMDPMCEDYRAFSPYVYCGNDPVNRCDPDGQNWVAQMVGKNVYFYYDRNIKSQADINRLYGAESGLYHIPDGLKIKAGQYTLEFHNDLKHNRDGFAYLNGEMLSKDKFSLIPQHYNLTLFISS